MASITQRSLTGALIVLFSTALSAVANAAPARAAGSPRAAAATLPAALRPALYQALANDTDPTYAVAKSGCATLPKQQLKGCFTAAGASFASSNDKRNALRLTAWGRGTVLHAVAQAVPTIEGNRVNYAHGALTEWWRVLPPGFEQGFTIARPPAGAGRLRLVIDANGTVKAEHGVLAIGKLRYGALVVTDASGKVIPSTLAAKDRQILIEVNDAGAHYPLTVDPLVWLEQKATAENGGAADFFGYSVALAGTTALVGAPFATVNGNNSQGAAYVFTESNGTWAQTAELTANGGAAYEYFGSSVALNGTTALVGAPRAIYANYQGRAYVFSYANGTWTQTGTLLASDGVAGDNFGISVALDGTTALVGARFASPHGAAYVFTNSGGSWTQTAELTASDGTGGDFFADSVSLSGTDALVGAPFATVNGNAQEGAAYVFTNSGGSWSQAQKLAPNDSAPYGLFGLSVALDGTTALVGASIDTTYSSDPGAAYVFTESGGSWIQMQKITPNDSAPYDRFGYSVALSGATAFVSAPDATVDGNQYQGAAYVFTNSGGTWSQTQKLVASDGTAEEGFGSSVAVGGTTALSSVPYSYASNQGAVYFEGETDLALALRAPDRVVQGKNYDDQAIATSDASAASPAVAVTVTVPAAASFISASASQGSCNENAGVVVCDFGPIGGNGGRATADVMLKATGNVGDTIENTARVSKATPVLTASAPTTITACPQSYTEYDGTLNAKGIYRSPPYQAPAGEENALLSGPSGFQLYAEYSNGTTQHLYRIPGNEIHKLGPAGTYRWGVKAGSAGGAYALCVLHP